MIDRPGVFDNIPTRVIFERMDATVARGHWFFLFNAVRDLPEALITGREEIWLRFIFASWTHDPDALTDQDIEVYATAYRQQGRCAARSRTAGAGKEDVAQDEMDKDIKIACPPLALWGEEFEAGGKMWDFPAVAGDGGRSDHGGDPQVQTSSARGAAGRGERRAAEVP